MPETDPKRVPVIAAVGQTIEREQTVDAVELAERAARAALAQAPALAARIERLSVIAVSFSPVGRAPASTLARRLGLSPARCEVTRAGGNMPPVGGQPSRARDLSGPAGDDPDRRGRGHALDARR